MFCHNCGAKLVNGAKFCSFCGTLVPEEILSMMQSTSTPVSEVKSIPKQETIPEPELEKITEPEPISKKDSTPEPVQVSEPELVSKQDLTPEPVQVPEPEPEQVIANVIVTATQVQNGETIQVNAEGMLAPLSLQLSKEMKSDLKIFLPKAQMVPASNGAKRELVVHLHVIGEPAKPQESQQKTNIPQLSEPEPEPERITINLTVTSEQLQNGETILINDDRMLAPLALQLSKEMKDGIKMRLSNARMAPAPGGAKRELVAHLHVLEVKPQPPENHKEPNNSQRSVQSDTSSTSQSNNASGWVQTSQSTHVPKPEERKKILIADSIPCGFLFAKPGKSTDGYHYGGNDGGAVSIYSHQLVLYRKSKMVGAAFGVIGSAIEGRGKQYATIPREDVSSFEKRYNKKGRVQDYLLHFRDGRTLKIIYYGKDNSFESAMDQFLQ